MLIEKGSAGTQGTQTRAWKCSDTETAHRCTWCTWGSSQADQKRCHTGNTKTTNQTGPNIVQAAQGPRTSQAFYLRDKRCCLPAILVYPERCRTGDNYQRNNKRGAASPELVPTLRNWAWSWGTRTVRENYFRYDTARETSCRKYYIRFGQQGYRRFPQENIQWLRHHSQRFYGNWKEVSETFSYRFQYNK